jgi:hypothetical protein
MLEIRRATCIDLRKISEKSKGIAYLLSSFSSNIPEWQSQLGKAVSPIVMGHLPNKIHVLADNGKCLIALDSKVPVLWAIRQNASHGAIRSFRENLGLQFAEIENPLLSSFLKRVDYIGDLHGHLARFMDVVEQIKKQNVSRVDPSAYIYGMLTGLSLIVAQFMSIRVDPFLQQMNSGKTNKEG